MRDWTSGERIQAAWEAYQEFQRWADSLDTFAKVERELRERSRGPYARVAAFQDPPVLLGAWLMPGDDDPGMMGRREEAL
jgi:hypothetical protein